jgi:hypothetical protein
MQMLSVQMQRGRGDPRGEVQCVGGSPWTGDRIGRGLAQGGPLGEGAALLRCQQSRRGEGRGYGGAQAAIWNSVTHPPWDRTDANPRPHGEAPIPSADFPRKYLQRRDLSSRVAVRAGSLSRGLALPRLQFATKIAMRRLALRIPGRPRGAVWHRPAAPVRRDARAAVSAILHAKPDACTDRPGQMPGVSACAVCIPAAPGKWSANCCDGGEVTGQS